jgi:hypothetical protein
VGTQAQAVAQGQGPLRPDWRGGGTPFSPLLLSLPPVPLPCAWGACSGHPSPRAPRNARPHPPLSPPHPPPPPPPPPPRGGAHPARGPPTNRPPPPPAPLQGAEHAHVAHRPGAGLPLGPAGRPRPRRLLPLLQRLRPGRQHHRRRGGAPAAAPGRPRLRHGAQVRAWVGEGESYCGCRKEAVFGWQPPAHAAAKRHFLGPARCIVPIATRLGCTPHRCDPWQPCCMRARRRRQPPLRASPARPCRSLGAAMATLCALDLRLNLRMPDVRVYTFGSPRVGNAVFARWFEDVVTVGAAASFHSVCRFPVLASVGAQAALRPGASWLFRARGRALLAAARPREAEPLPAAAAAAAPSCLRRCTGGSRTTATSCLAYRPVTWASIMCRERWAPDDFFGFFCFVNPLGRGGLRALPLSKIKRRALHEGVAPTRASVTPLSALAPFPGGAGLWCFCGRQRLARARAARLPCPVASAAARPPAAPPPFLRPSPALCALLGSSSLPFIPTSASPLALPAEQVWVVDLLFGHTLVGVCDDSGEDLACHNSMCHLGLCSSRGCPPPPLPPCLLWPAVPACWSARLLVGPPAGWPACWLARLC